MSRAACPPRGNCAGFSLAEALSTVAVIGILAGIGTAYVLSQLPLYRVNGAVRQVVGDLRLAKSMAVSQGRAVYLVFEPAHNRYHVVPDSNGNEVYDPPGAGADVVEKTVVLPDLYEGVEMYSHPGVPTSPVTFNAETASFTPNGRSNGGTVFLRPARDAGVREDRQRKVTVMSITARARTYRWDGSNWV